VSEHEETSFKPVAPMPEHKDHHTHNQHTAHQPMAAPMPSSMSGLTTEGMTTKPASVLAVIALILGIISFFITLLALPALIVSILAMKQTSGGKQSGRGMAIAGLVLSIIDILIALLIGVIFLFSFIAGRNAAKTINTDYTPATSTSLSSTKTTLTGTVKAPLVADHYTLTVNSIEHGFKGTRDYYSPSAGNEFILVNITVKNNDAYSQYVSSYDFAVRDASGVDHDNKFMLDVPNDFSYKTLDKGAERTGNIVFEVPLNSTKQTLVYTPGYFSNNKAEIAL
jgi:hypothetical protein